MKRWERLIRFGTRITDVAIPAVLAALALNDIWGTPLSSPHFQGPRGVQTAGALLMTIPLGWRRRYPIAVLFCALAGAAVEWPGIRSGGQLSFGAFITALIAWYSVGAHADPRWGPRAALIAAGAAGGGRRGGRHRRLPRPVRRLRAVHPAGRGVGARQRLPAPRQARARTRGARRGAR